MSVLLQHFIQASYELERPPVHIGDFTLVAGWTKTMKAYVKRGRRTGIVCVRGTKEALDWETNLRIPFNGTIFGNRFTEDWAWLQKLRAEVPDIVWVAVGHSLGGALIDEFLERGLVSQATTFNPAVAPKNYASGLPNRRIYYLGDPLYTLMGQYVTNPVPELYSASAGAWLTRIIGVIGRLGTESIGHIVATELKHSHKHEHLAEHGGTIDSLVPTLGVRP